MSNRLPDDMFAREISNEVLKYLPNDVRVTQSGLYTDINTHVTRLSNGLNICFYVDKNRQYFYIAKNNISFVFQTNPFTLQCNGFKKDYIISELENFGKYSFVNYLADKTLIVGNINEILSYCQDNEIEVTTWSNVNDMFIFSYTFNRNGVASYEVRGYRNY